MPFYIDKQNTICYDTFMKDVEKKNENNSLFFKETLSFFYTLCYNTCIIYIKEWLDGSK